MQRANRKQQPVAKTSTVAARVAELNRQYSDLHLSLGPCDTGWQSLADLAQAGLPEALFKQAEFTKGLDAKGQAAYLIGNLPYRLVGVLVALHWAGLSVVRLDGAGVFYRWEQYQWEYEGATGQDHRLLLRLHPENLAECPAPPIMETARPGLTTILEPLVVQLVSATGLSRAALWRQAADGVAGGFLYAGRALGFEAQAIAEGTAFLRLPGSPLTNKQSGFVTLTVCDDASGRRLSETFRLRGGCCRYYTCDGGSYCSTCVLRPAEEREALLTDYLRSELAQSLRTNPPASAPTLALAEPIC